MNVESKYSEFSDKGATALVSTPDDGLWHIFQSLLEQKGWSVRRIEDMRTNPDHPGLWIVDVRRMSDSVAVTAWTMDMDLETPILWVVDDDAARLSDVLHRLPFSEVIRFPFRDFEFDQRMRTLQTFSALSATIHGLDRSFKSETSKWKKQAFTDSITGLSNYRYFKDRLQVELRRANRLNESVSLVIFDLDDFKVLNDRHGHQAGDKLLHDAGRLIRQSVRKTDTVARYGGDEFVLILTLTDSMEAVPVASKISERIRNTVFEVRDAGASCRITLSAGIAGFPHDAQDRDSLIRCADQALYRAKSEGKQQICSYDPKDRMRS